MKPLPESPGMPGVRVATMWLQPSPSFWISDALLGAELGDAAAQLRVAVGVDGRARGRRASPTPVGPPKPGTEGLTLPTSAGSILISARSLYSQVSGLDSWLACIVSQEL